MPPSPLDDACPGEEDVAAFLDGCLVSARARALEAHVARCAACRHLLSALARTAAAASQPTADSVAPTLPAEPRASETELPVGARIGRYLVLDWIGAGGMGVVYSAYDPELHRKVALKVLRNDGAGPTDRGPIHDQLLREAQAMAQLAHPNVVTVFDVGSVGERVFLAMELVEGVTLARWLRAVRRGRREIIAAFLAAGNGLAAAHAAGLIHRDFKPDNVLVGNDGRICVTDFGLARGPIGEPLDAVRSGAAPPGRGINTTRTGLAGTLAYMAPEQFLGLRPDARADQFSFAVALHEALHGERPFMTSPPGDDDDATNGRVRASPHGRGVPGALRRVLLRALSTRPDDRYPSMTALLAALAPVLRPRRGRLFAVGAIAIAAAAVTAAGSCAMHLRRVAEQRTELVGRLRGLVPEMRLVLRSAHMLPLHDIRSAREQVRGAMRDVEHRLNTPVGQDEIALGTFVLGEAHRALGDHERALGLLEAAWAGGERGPEIDAALGHALGAAYESRLDQIEQTVQSADREVQIRALEQRYRDPAMSHMEAALAARVGSPAYLEALIAFHAHRFAEASQRAQAAFGESPTFYEAGMLAARARSEAGRQRLTAGKDDEAIAEFLAARQIFERVLEIARSDDEAWLADAEMLSAQATALARDGELPPDLQAAALTALHNVQRINPENWKAFVQEAQIELGLGNIDLIWDRDPGQHVDRALGLTSEARAHDPDASEVDVQACVAHWQRAMYQATRGIDPHAAFTRALAACQSAATAKPDADKYASLGAIYLTLASYDGEHGRDPTRNFELGEHNLTASLAIENHPLTHYNLARLWTRLAQYQAGHGANPERAVDSALAEYQATAQKNTTLAAVWEGTSDALAARAWFELDAHVDAQPTLALAHAAVARALAIEPGFVSAIRSRMMLSEIDVEALLAHDADPTGVVEPLRTDAQRLASRRPGDGFAHVAWCRAELAAARWAFAHHQAVDHLVTRAATEAARARDSDAADALAWTASAEVELLRAEVMRARRPAASAAAVVSGLGFIARAAAIDPWRVRTRRVRDELARQVSPTR